MCLKLCYSQVRLYWFMFYSFWSLLSAHHKKLWDTWWTRGVIWSKKKKSKNTLQTFCMQFFFSENVILLKHWYTVNLTLDQWFNIFCCLFFYWMNSSCIKESFVSVKRGEGVLISGRGFHHEIYAHTHSCSFDEKV